MFTTQIDPMAHDTTPSPLRPKEGHFGVEREVCRIDGAAVRLVHYPRDVVLPRHDHEHATLCHVLAGGYEENYGLRASAACAGDTLIHPSGSHHANRKKAGCHLLIIEIEPSLLAASGMEKAFDRHAVVNADGLRTTAEELARVVTSGARTQVGELVFAALSLATCPDGPLRGTPAWLALVEEALRDPCADAMSVTRLAEIAGVHPVHLARVFRQTHGCTSSTFSRFVRVERAAVQVAQGRRPLSEIAIDAGFADQSHFTRAFASIYGIPPARYRKLAGRPDV